MTAEATIGRARSEWPVWRDTPLRERLERLGALRRAIAARRAAIAALVAAETGKPALEALINEVLPTLEAIRYHERHACRILAPERRRGSLLFRRSRFHVEYRPRGVVLVLAPSNLPFQLAIVPTVAALAAGNAVVCKVSERAPRIAVLLEELFRAAGLPPAAVRIDVGGAAVAESLVRASPDLVFLTGGTVTGRRVMQLAAESLTPVILELGGKDAMIVLADAPLERAVEAAVYGACANAGQTCVAVQRIYVEQPLFERFVSAVTARVRQLRLGADVGPLISASAAARFKALVDDAVARGAVLHTRLTVHARAVTPVVLTGVTAEMRIMRDETFGPALPIVPVADSAEAIRLANDSPFGLSASVWTRDLDRGRRLAACLDVGAVAVNDVLKTIGNPDLPFGGCKWSGIGVYRGPEGLRAFSRPLSVAVNDGRAGSEPNWFPYDAAKARRIDALIALRYASRAFAMRAVHALVANGRAPTDDHGGAAEARE